MADGSKMMFPVEHAKKVQRKNALVLRAVQLQNILKTAAQGGATIPAVDEELTRVMRSIRSLNRQIPPCGTTVRESV